MKKVLVAIVAVAMMVSLFAVASHASTGMCFDGAFLTNNAEVNTHVPTSDEKDEKAEATAGELGSIYGLNYSYIHFQGWFADDDEFTDIGYQINGGEITWGVSFMDQNILSNTAPYPTGHLYALRFNFNMAVAEGDVTIKFIEKMADGSNKEAHTIHYTNAAPDPNVKTYSNKNIGVGTAIGVWLQGDNHSATLEFTTASAFKGFGLPIYWASNANVPNGPFAKYKIELFKFAYNPEYTLSQAPVKSYELDGEGDNKPVFAFDFDEALEAGTYIARFTITNFDEILRGKQNGQGDDVDMTPYLVLPKMDANPDPAKFEFSTADAFNFYVVGEDGIEDFYAANPENTDAPSQPTTGENPPETQPQTGDAAVAMIAVLAVLAMGAAVVFAKKRSF